MAIKIVPTSASQPVPDQCRIQYELRDTTAGTVIDTGSVIFTFPYDPTQTAAERRAAIRTLFQNAVRHRVDGLIAARLDFAAIQNAIAAGQMDYP